jgi:serine protease
VRGTTLVTRYDSAGRVLVQEMAIGTGVQDVAMDGAGNLAVLRMAPDGSGNGTFVTIYNRTGSVVVPEFRVNDATAGEQYPGAIAMNASGQFAVAWFRGSTSTTLAAVYVKRYQSNGVAVATETVASAITGTGTSIAWNDVAIDAQGNFVLVWDQVEPSNQLSIDVWVRRFSSTGYALGAPFLAHADTAKVQGVGRVACNDTGSFVVLWTSNIVGDPDPWAYYVYGQRYNAAGAKLGGEFRVSVQPGVFEEHIGVGMAADGSFAVTWSDYRASSSRPLQEVNVRAYDRNGAAIGEPFLAGAADDRYNLVPSMAMDRDGNYVISWYQSDGLSGETDVYARRFSTSGISVTPLVDNQLMPRLSGATHAFTYYKITVPPGRATLDVTISGGTGDADLYVRQGSLPTLSRWDGRPYLDGNNEGVRMRNFPPGDWYIGLYGYGAYSGVSLRALSY